MFYEYHFFYCVLASLFVGEIQGVDAEVIELIFGRFPEEPLFNKCKDEGDCNLLSVGFSCHYADTPAGPLVRSYFNPCREFPFKPMAGPYSFLDVPDTIKSIVVFDIGKKGSEDCHCYFIIQRNDDCVFILNESLRPLPIKIFEFNNACEQDRAFTVSYRLIQCWLNPACALGVSFGGEEGCFGGAGAGGAGK